MSWIEWTDNEFEATLTNSVEEHKDSKIFLNFSLNSVDHSTLQFFTDSQEEHKIFAGTLRLARAHRRAIDDSRFSIHEDQKGASISSEFSTILK